MKSIKKVLIILTLFILFPITALAISEPRLTDVTFDKFAFEFNPDVKNYNLKYYNFSTNRINITAEAVSGYEITGDGQKELADGDNQFSITVSNGTSSNTYTFNVNFSRDGSNVSQDSETAQKSNNGNPDTADIDITTFALLAVGSLLLLLFLRSKRKLMELNSQD